MRRAGLRRARVCRGTHRVVVADDPLGAEHLGVQREEAERREEHRERDEEEQRGWDRGARDRSGTPSRAEDGLGRVVGRGVEGKATARGSHIARGEENASGRGGRRAAGVRAGRVCGSATGWAPPDLRART